MRALLLENLHPLASSILTEAGIGVETHPGALGEDELVASLESFDLLGIRSKTEVTARVLDAHPSFVGLQRIRPSNGDHLRDAVRQSGVRQATLR